MTQTQRDVLAGSQGNRHQPKPTRGLAGWLVLADPDGPIDLRRLFPDVAIRVYDSSADFALDLEANEPDLVILFAPPAGLTDIQRLAVWSSAHLHTRTVLLSPHNSVTVRLHALEQGFDDAIDVTSDPMELVGRLSIAGRRGPEASHSLDRIYISSGIELDLRAKGIRRDGRLLTMRPRELALLYFFATHPGRAFSRDELLTQVWHRATTSERMVDVYVYWLRAKIEEDPSNPTRLVTVRGSGYLFERERPAPRQWDPALNVNELPTPR